MFLQNLIYNLSRLQEVFQIQNFYDSPFMLAVEDVDVLRSKWLLSLFALIKLFSNYLNKTNAQFSSEVITS